MSARSVRPAARAVARRMVPSWARPAARRISRRIAARRLPSVDLVVVVEPIDLPRLDAALRSMLGQEDADPAVVVCPVAGAGGAVLDTVERLGAERVRVLAEEPTWQRAAGAGIAAGTSEVFVLARGCDPLARDAVRRLASRIGRTAAVAGGPLGQAGVPDPWLRRFQEAAWTHGEDPPLDVRLAGVAVRREAWGQRRLGEHDTWLASPTLAGLLAQQGPPVVTAGEVATWQPDHGTRAYGATPSPLPALAESSARWDRVARSLAGSPLAGRWRASVVGYALPRLLQDAERADAEQWAALQDLARAEAGRGGWADEVGPAARAMVWLAAAGRRADVERVAVQVSDHGDDLCTTRTGSRVHADWGVVDLPAEVVALRPTETVATAHVERAVPVGPDLLVDLFVAVGGVDLADPATRIEVRDRQGAVLATTPLPPAAATRWAGRRFQSAAAVRVEVPGARRGRLTVTVTVGELERTVGVELPAAPITARGPVTVAAVSLDGGALLLDARGAVDRLGLEWRGESVAAPVEVRGDRVRVALEAERFGRPAALAPGSYRLVVDGENVSVAAGLAAQLPDEHVSERHRVRWHLGPRGGLVVDLAPPLADDEAGPHAQQRLQAAYRVDDRPVDPGLVYLESYAGRTATDSPLAVFDELRRRRPDLRMRWGVADAGQLAPPGAEPVLLRSREWYGVLATAGALVVNTDTEAWFRRRPGQVLLQTFHGYPSKAMGASQWSAQEYPPSRVRELRARGVDTWSAIVTPTPEMTQLYRQQYGYDGPALERGYPRDDALVAPDAAERRARARRLLGIADDQVAVLYAPTWREQLAFRPRGAAMTDYLDVAAAARALGPSYVLLLRGHRFHTPPPVGTTDGRVLDVTAYPEVNDLILAADASVLDYSSIRFDIALTGRPMVFLVPDLKEYAAGTRRFLFPFEESAPGPLVTTTAEVVEQLRDVGALQRRWAGDLERFVATYQPWQDGHAAERVVDGLLALLEGSGAPGSSSP